MKHSLKLFYTFILPSTILHLTPATWEREREREAPTETPTETPSNYLLDYTYYPITILHANRTLETIFRCIFQNTTKQLTVHLFAGLYIFFNNHFMCKPNIRNHFWAYFPKHNQTIEKYFPFQKNFHLKKFYIWKTFYMELDIKFDSWLHVCGTVVHVPTTITNNTNWWY